MDDAQTEIAAESPLLQETITLLKARGNFRRVAAETGLGYDWLNKLAQGCIHDPGVRKIQRLNTYLKSTPQAA